MVGNRVFTQPAPEAGILNPTKSHYVQVLLGSPERPVRTSEMLVIREGNMTLLLGGFRFCFPDNGAR